MSRATGPPPAAFAVPYTFPAGRFAPAPPPSARTCECLTQTLHCHTCGGSVGYTIVAPCARCTAPTAAHRGSATNGHRFVFYASDILAQERRYVHGERGVVPHHPQWHVPFAAMAYSAQSTDVNGMPVARHSALPVAHAALHSSEPPSFPSAQGWTAFAGSTSDDRDQPSLTQSGSRPLPPVLPGSQAYTPASYIHMSPASPSDRLHSGDIVYWHNLARSGEIPAVSDDPRSRAFSSGASTNAANGTGSGRARSHSDGQREIKDQLGASSAKRGDARYALTDASQSSRRTRAVFAGR